MATTTVTRPSASNQHRGSSDQNPLVTSALSVIVAPRFRHDPNWPWITCIKPMDQWSFDRIYIDNVYERFPKATRIYRRWQYARAAKQIRRFDLAFLFSTDIGIGVTNRLRRSTPRPHLLYVGFTQDGPWPGQRIRKVAKALQRCDVVTIFTEEERRVYLERYGLAPEQAVVVPIHTDEADGYRQYPDESPHEAPYVVALGSPNRRFTPTARICNELGVPLVIITRPWHTNDSLDQLRSRGAKIVTDANKLEALTYLKHARLAVMPFDDPVIAGGYTTIMHAMFLRTPIVSTRCLGVPEHIIDGETGFVTPHSDDESLKGAIDRLWSEPGLAQRLGEAAKARAQTRHSLKAAARNFAQLTQKLLQVWP
ncbi:MAG: glycosyltransferase family 4 protein [Phycisphaerales bacterium]